MSESRTIEATKGGTTIRFTLYGDLSDTRIEREQKVLMHRLEQLSR